MNSVIFLATYIFGASIQSAQIHDAPRIKTNFIKMTKTREKLTLKYVRQHYGLKSIALKNPKIIVIHYTKDGNFQKIFNLFSEERLAKGRSEGQKHGKMNVSVHFLVDKDGSIMAIFPTKYICRHVIGFNHVSIGIENIAENEDALTEQQLVANAFLVKILVRKYPSIEYLIGHHESTNQNLPHYKYLLQKDKTYAITANPDPGTWYMHLLRRYLYHWYRIWLKD